MLRLTIAALLVAACTSAPVPTSTRSPAPPASLGGTGAPSVTAFEFGDGTHRVPADVPPGTYRTIAYADNCYWTRLRGFENGLEDIVATRIGAGYDVVTIGAHDAGFDSVDCGTWTSDVTGTGPGLASEFGEGTYIVGVNIEPGTYTAGAGGSCEWARLRGFGGTPQEVVEGQFVGGGPPPTVVIAPSDTGFTSSGCGTWEREP